MTKFTEMLHETRVLMNIYKEQYTSEYDPSSGYTKLLAATLKRYTAKYDEETALRMYAIATHLTMRYYKMPQSDELFYDGQ